MSRVHRLMLWCAATDRTFHLADLQGQTVLAGKCIHCKREVCVDLKGRSVSRASLEHIVPRNHGGSDDLENLAIACRSCNTTKGRHHDVRDRFDPKLQSIIEFLKQRREERQRPPIDGVTLPSLEQHEEAPED